ncbi:MAG: phospho-sugar mutase [Myxococcota bacterium]|nr:phospho-sugar mutase [Myxococcota bacterium]
MNPPAFLDQLEAALAVSERHAVHAQKVIEGVASWLSDPVTAADLGQLCYLLDKGCLDDLVDAFYQVIPFGTGGRRGAVGIGPNRINPQTVCSSVQGHCQYLAKRFPDEPLSVVIAYDVRVFRDARGVYDSAQPCSVRGLSSRDFAEMAAEVYAGNGVEVYLLSQERDTWVSTPELSFAIRELGAKGGLNLSASHNPPDDNGAKVYNHHGGQEIPPYDEHLVEEVEQVEAIRRLSLSEALAIGRVRDLPEELHDAYVAHNLSLSSGGSRTAKIVFTPLHGTADTSVGDVLRAAGFDVTVEPEQVRPDGAFPTVPFGAPNPEVPESMDRALALGQAQGADLVMSCDPDADRLGVVVRTSAGWRPLSGNEIAILVTEAALRSPRCHARSIVMRTEVTSSLVSRLAEARGVRVVDHLLVGFKYIGDGIRALDEQGAFAGVEGGASDFLVGVEESHGVLVTAGVRDKDAAGGALLLAEMASEEKGLDRTLMDCLEDIWSTHGQVANVLVSTVMRGAAGRQQIEAIQRSLREHPPASIGGLKVLSCRDHQDPEGIHGPIRSGTDRSSRDVLSYSLEGQARVIVRPSGTEPKTKVYAEMVGNSASPSPELAEACSRLAKHFVRDMLRRVGIELPAWTQEMSGLLSVEHRVDFAQRVFPELLQRLEEKREVEKWLEGQIESYGRDAIRLVGPGVRAWVAEQNAEHTGLEALFSA